jgi:hypothetical protein
MKKEMHGHAHNFMLECTFQSAATLVQCGVTSAAEVDTAACHMARLLLASGGISGALVGCVGNGDEAAFVDLGTDILIGAPWAVSAALLSWCLPAWLAAIFVAVLTAFARVLTGSRLVKQLGRKMTWWWNTEFIALWRAQSDEEKAGFEEKALKRMAALSRLG